MRLSLVNYPHGIPQWEMGLSHALRGVHERRRTTLHGGVVRGSAAAHVNDGWCRERARDRRRRVQMPAMLGETTRRGRAAETAVCFSGLNDFAYSTSLPTALVEPNRNKVARAAACFEHVPAIG